MVFIFANINSPWENNFIEFMSFSGQQCAILGKHQNYIAVLFLTSAVPVCSVAWNDLISLCGLVAISCFTVADSEEISLLTHSVTLTLTWWMEYHEEVALVYCMRTHAHRRTHKLKKDARTGTHKQTHRQAHYPLYKEGNYDETIIWYKTGGRGDLHGKWTGAWWNKREDYSCAFSVLLSSSLCLRGFNKALSHFSPMTGAVSSFQREGIWFSLGLSQTTTDKEVKCCVSKLML